jgi:hypothetical protein
MKTLLPVNGEFKWKYVACIWAPRGARAQFSLPRAIFSDNILPDVRFGPDGKLYELGSSQ